MEAISYGSVYVARVAMGGNDVHTVRAFLEAEVLRRPSIIIAYSHCIAHGYDMAHRPRAAEGRRAVGLLAAAALRPTSAADGKNPFQLDSPPPSIPFRDYAYQEARYTMLARSDPDAARELLAVAQEDVDRQWRVYAGRAAMPGHAATSADRIDTAVAAPLATAGAENA